MKRQTFTLDGSTSNGSRYAIDRLRADGEGHLHLPLGLVPILDDDFSDDGMLEPDGVNNIVRHTRAEELDQR